MTRLPLSALALLVATGCAASPGVTSAPADAGVTATATLAVRGSDERVLLTLPTEDMVVYTSADVGRVVLKLYTAAGSTVLQSATLNRGDGTEPANQLNDELAFSKLSYNTDYRIEATAFLKTDLTKQIDNSLNADQASKNSCITTFSTGLNPTVSIGRIQVQLRKQEFDGQAATDLQIHDGAVTDVAGTETIDIEARP